MTATPSIASLEVTAVHRRIVSPLVVRGGRGTHASSSFAVVRLTLSDGTEGFGEVSGTLAWSGEDSSTACYLVRRHLRPALVGLTADESLVQSRLDLVVARHTFTKAGVNTALLDALSRRAGLSLAEYVSGSAPARTSVPVKMSLSGDGPVVEAAFQYAQAVGFTAYKVKVGRQPDKDIERVRMVRSLAGTGALVGADANGGWDVTATMRCLRELSEAKLAFIEQPLPERDLRGMAGIRALGTPVIADESVYDEHDLLDVHERGAADMVSIYVGKSGGPRQAFEMAKKARRHGLGVVIGSNAELGIGAAAQVQLACALPEAGAVPHDIVGDLLYTEPTTVGGARVDGRTAALPGGPGLGATPLPAVLKGLS